MFINSTEVKLIKQIDTTDSQWCDSAVMFSVKNGKGALCEKYGPENEDYECSSQLLFNDKPIVQARIPDCPTCKGLLAAGYGIENVDCPELKAARDYMNSEFTNITDAAEKIKPLLGLLADGYYVLADAICLPSNGDGKFFYDVSKELKYCDAACCDYYCNWNYKCVRHFPLFLYPTQSSSLINKERVEYYAQMMKSGTNPPRALAYLYAGFVNVLLDGHHKACAAASVRGYVRCLTIIPADGCRFEQGSQQRCVGQVRSNRFGFVPTVEFAGLKTEVESLKHFEDVWVKRRKSDIDLTVKQYDLTAAKIHYGPDRYPTIRDLMFLMTSEEKTYGVIPQIDYADIMPLLEENSDETDLYLEAVMNYLATTDFDMAYRLAGDIIRHGDDRMRHHRVRAALLFLLANKCDKSEQLVIDFYLSHNEQDENWELANSYWKSD